MEAYDWFVGFAERSETSMSYVGHGRLGYGIFNGQWRYYHCLRGSLAFFLLVVVNHKHIILKRLPAVAEPRFSSSRFNM